MTPKLEKVLKIALISIVSFLFLVVALIAFAINFIFTPAKLTPVVLKVVNESLYARLDMEEVELTFFSTFPRFGLKLTEGRLVSGSLHDTTLIASRDTVTGIVPPSAALLSRQDSLLSFKECLVTVDPLAYLQHNQISIHDITLQDASVYAFRNKNGQSNWDILKERGDTTTVQKDTISSSFDSSIDIKNLELKNANIIFDDRSTDVYTQAEDVNLHLKASLTEGKSSLSLLFTNKNILFWQQGELLINKVASSIQTDILIDRQTLTYELRNTGVTLNGIRFDANGTFVRDTVAKTIAMDVRYGLHTPSVGTVLGMIPESIMKKSQVNAKGEVTVSGEVQGVYGEKHLPAVSLKIEINDASAQYADMPYGIDRFSASLEARIDLMRTQSSFLDLKLFRFQGAHTDILANVRVDELLRDPLVTFTTKATADLTALAQTFPWQEGVKLGGLLNADLQLQCRLSAVRKQDIGRIKLSGELSLNDIFIRDSLKGFNFSSNAAFRFSGDNTLQAEAEISQLILNSKFFSTSMERLTAKVTSSNPKDTTRVVALECRMDMNKLQASTGDSVTFYTGHTQAVATLAPGKRDATRPRLGLSFRTDSFYFKIQDTYAGLGLARFDFQAEKLKDSLWLPEGEVEFDKLFLSTPEFTLPVRMGQTIVNLDKQSIILHNARLQVGHSDLTASGSVDNLFGALMHNETLKARLDIRSEYLDCNQILGAFPTSKETDSKTSVVAANKISATEASSGDMKLFVIPKNIDFELQTQVGKVTFDKMVFENINSLVQIKDQAVYLSNLSMRALEAEMKAVLVYKATSGQQAFTGFDFNIQDINVGKLVDFIPTLDSIVPMLRSFKGLVDFNVALETQLDSTMSMRIPTLKSAINIKGDSLVLMDGETFAEIAKMLMFKNKKENIFDNISVNITVNDGKVIVYPFLIEIDRYKAAVGGTQGLDLNFDYHISILKSPLPFKAGVNISGNLDKMKFRIGKAKYKDAVSPAEIRKVDSTRINLGQEITGNFMRLWK